jgi:hypothetical protein
MSSSSPILAPTRWGATSHPKSSDFRANGWATANVIRMSFIATMLDWPNVWRTIEDGVVIESKVEIG